MTRPNQSIPRCKCGHHYNNHMDWVDRRGPCKDENCACMAFNAEDWVLVQQIENRLIVLESMEIITARAIIAIKNYMSRNKNKA